MQNLKGLRILLIDDDTDNRDFLSFLLESEGADILAAKSAQEGLEVWQQNTPDLLLCDMTMPDYNGCWLIEQVRAREAGGEKQCPAIALTGLSSANIHQQALAAGFQMYLIKPIDAECLISAIVSLSNPKGKNTLAMA